MLSIVGIVALYLVTVEVLKRLFYKRYDFTFRADPACKAVKG